MNVHRLFFTIFLGRILPSFEKKARPGKKLKADKDVTQKEVWDVE